jgi:hypothetical protein
MEIPLNKKKVINKIKALALELEVNPSQITKKIFLENTTITDWQLRKIGGFDLIKKANFPHLEKDLASIRESQEESSYINKLEKTLADRQLFEQRLIEAVKNQIKPIKAFNPPVYKHKKGALHRELVMMLNDTHYGLLVDPDEIGETNKYGWTEACRRTAKVVQEALDYKTESRSEVKSLHLILNGDLVQGIIHGLTTRGAELSVFHATGAIHILTHVIHNLAKEFKKVQVHGNSGNHSDSPHKREGGSRVIQEKFDNVENIIFYALSAAFKNVDHVTFNFPKTPYVSFQLPAGRALASHGDTIFGKALGNPGTSINVKRLSEEIRKFNAGEIIKGRPPVKLILFGHTHSFAHFITSEGVEVYVAPSLSGVDPFAHSLNINTNIVGQTIFESTPHFILGDSRLIRLLDADSDSNLDKLIPTYNNSLKWQK